MELKLENGAYCAGRSGLETVSGAEELAQRILMKLTARRGGFAPLPEYGSRLYQLHMVRPSRRETAARQYIAEALAGETGLWLERLEIREPQPNRMELELHFRLDSGGQLALTTTI